MPCVVTHSRSSSASWMSRDRWRTFCSMGMVNAPLPTTILKPSPAASPSGPECARRPEIIRASLGSATLYRNIVVPTPLPLRIAADDDGARLVVLDHDHARSLRDLL